MLFGSYRNVVRVIPTDTGLYFYTMFLFRAFHRPFLLPWERVTSIVTVRSFFITRLRLRATDGAGSIDMLLPKKFAEALQEHVTAPLVESA